MRQINKAVDDECDNTASTLITCHISVQNAL